MRYHKLLARKKCPRKTTRDEKHHAWVDTNPVYFPSLKGVKKGRQTRMYIHIHVLDSIRLEPAPLPPHEVHGRECRRTEDGISGLICAFHGHD